MHIEVEIVLTRTKKTSKIKKDYQNDDIWEREDKYYKEMHLRFTSGQSQTIKYRRPYINEKLEVSPKLVERTTRTF